MRQKEEFQKEATKTFFILKDNTKRKNEKYFFRKERKLHQTILPSGKGRNLFLEEFSKKKSSKKNFCFFLFFRFFCVKTFDKEQTGDEEGGMNEKEGEVEKNNRFRSFVFEQRRQENREERFAKLFFFKKGSERQRKQETKRNNRDKQPKGWKKRQVKKHPNKGIISKTIGERKKKLRKTRFAKCSKR